MEWLIGILDSFLFPLLALPAWAAVFLVCLALSFLLVALNTFFTDKKFLSQSRERMKQLQEKLLASQRNGNKEKIRETVQEFMQLQKQYLKQTLRLFLVSMALFLIFIPWLHAKFGGTPVVELPFSLPFLGSKLGWLGWYLLLSLTFTLIFRKFLM